MYQRRQVVNNDNVTPTVPEYQAIVDEIAEVREELARISARLEASLSESGNPVSVKCSNVLSQTPKCYDFQGSRRFSACRAWQVMEEEKIPWQEAISKAWRELKEKCTWN